MGSSAACQGSLRRAARSFAFPDAVLQALLMIVRRASGVRTVVVALAFVAVAGAIAARTARNLEVPGRPDLPLYGMQDFRDGIYYPMRGLLDGINPYSPSALARAYASGSVFPLYAPITFIVHLPFGLVDQRVAESLFFALTLLLTVGLAYVAVRLCDLDPAPATVLGFAAALVASRPGHMNLYVGQCAAYLTLATYAALRLAPTRPWLAGAALAITCLKPSFGAPLAVLLLAGNTWRPVLVGGALAAALSLALAPTLVAAAGGVAPLVASFAENYAVWSVQPDISQVSSVHSIDATAFVGRIAGRSLGTGAQLAVTILVLGVASVAFARAARGGPRTRLLAETIACLTVLAAMHHQIYDMLLLALPVAALASGRLASARGPVRGRMRVALLALLVVPAVNYLAADTAIDYLRLSRPAWLVVTSADAAAILAALALAVALTLEHAPCSRVDVPA